MTIFITPMHTQLHGTLRVIATFITLMHTPLHEPSLMQRGLRPIIQEDLRPPLVMNHLSNATFVQYNMGNLSGLKLVPFMQCRVASLASP